MADDAAPLNANEIVAKVIVEAANQTLKGVSRPVFDKARRALHLVTDAYRPYLESTFQRVRNIKTFLKPNEPVDLLKIYVPAYLSKGQQKLDSNLLVEKANSHGRVVISGLAGRGKSVLMRYTAISMYHSPQGKIPIFLELRSLNQVDTKDLLSFIHVQYGSNRSSVKIEDFKRSLDRGYFSLILDGFDEVDPSSRSEIESEILDISRQYPLLSIIVSSRPDARFQSWQDFEEYQVCPMALEQAKELITRAEYDEDVTSSFLSSMTPEFYRKHESFLATPLLTIMMMLTFEDYAEIPTSLHAFYKNAFDTLIRRHDATKTKFVRKMHSNCTAEQFQLLFSSFSLLTYSRSKFEFTRSEVLKYLNAALDQQQISANAECVLDDLIESICLLQEEGFEISFVHRSFQEYFCALFLSLSPSGMVKSFFDNGKFRIWDDMLPMLYGMARDRVEQEWANETVNDICDHYVNGRPTMEYVVERFAGLLFFIGERKSIQVSLDDNDFSRRISIIQRLYQEHFDNARKGVNGKHHYNKKWQGKLKTALTKMEAAGDARLTGFSGSNRKGFSFPLKQNDTDVVNALNLIDISEEEMRALNEIRTHQLKRQRHESEFIKSIFGETDL